MNTISKLWQKLRDPEYRKAFVASQINIGIPFQIRALLKSRPGWTQTTLAERTDMLQPRISSLMAPGKTRPNIETLRRIAEAFDCGLLIRFVPFSELARWSDEFDPESFNVPSFDSDMGFVERKPPMAAAYATTGTITASARTAVGASAFVDAYEPSTGSKLVEMTRTTSRLIASNTTRASEFATRQLGVG